MTQPVESWTPDLAGRNRVKYLALVEAIAAAVAAGDLKPGDRLPTHRDLAWRLGVNTSTITQAYREAARRHLVSGEVGRGTYVLADSAEAALFALKAPGPGEGGAAHVVDLSTNVPATDPEDTALADALAALLADGEAAALTAYHPPALLRRAAAAGAHWLAGRGLPVRPGDVVPCAGAQQGLLAVLLALAGPGETVLVEASTFPGMKALARQLRLKLHPLPMDGEGITPEGLEAACRQTASRVAVLVPVLQNPTAATMGPERRASVAEVAQRHGVTVVEDDVYGGLTDTPPLAALLPAHGVVVTGLAKVAAPGLRFGCIAGPPRLLEPVRAEVHATSWPASPLMLSVACRWIEDGTAARRQAWQRAEIAERRRLAERILGRTLAPAPHQWLAVSDDPADVAERARAVGVEVVPAPVFAVGRERPAAVRVSLTAARTRRDLAVGLERLAAVLAG
ncbi:Aspartate aminotransferase [Caenispirillum salinarum AK4]|uniref:Aspartate aminotransferase n=1 Tax=Caenispirillum salinarum AK4 TaxID=1238182 RepID=K9GWB2_9PROT|nr:PLP-dependent aminotransferase family protein [Caenispirillum salinarum]EKV29542.1 Aspartate aminotransferase [Caenispirillum salinarum AK4]